MRNFLMLFCQMLVACVVAAQTVVPSPKPQPTKIDPDTIMPPGKFYVNPTTFIKGKRGGSNTANYGVSSQSINITSSSHNTGQFRIPCKLSHLAGDDPLVHPNRPGASHIHAFYGQTETAAATIGDFSTFGSSTCHGGSVNKTGYWVPILVYHCPFNEVGCDRKRDGEAIFGEGGNFYYKTVGGNTSNNTVWPPADFRMITGSATNSNPGNLPGRIECWKNGGPNPVEFPGYVYDHIPTVAETASKGGCDELNFFIQFPVCWDGINIDSPDHKSHVIYNANAEPYAVGCGGAGTDPGYPVQFPEITLNVHVAVNPADLDYIRFSSDQPKATATGLCADAAHNWCAGASMHSDWVNGWSREPNFGGFGEGTITDLILKYCYRKGSPTPQNGDCHDDLFYVAPDGVTNYQLF